jgi:hypothetical protein
MCGLLRLLLRIIHITEIHTVGTLRFLVVMPDGV